MGIELKLEVTPEDIKMAYTGDRRKLYLAKVKDEKAGPQPNLICNPLTLIVSPFGEDGLFNAFLNEKLGGDNYNAFMEALTSCVNTSNRLFYNFLVENLGEEKPHELDELARQHHRELSAFAQAYTALHAITVNPEAIMEEDRNSLDREFLARKSDVGKRSIEDYWELGIKGLKDVVLIANHLYGMGTMEEFLTHVNRGVIDREYLLKLRGNLPAGASPQTL